MQTLEIHLDGADPAIASHRMSLEHVSAYAKLLSAAYRRTAQQLLTGHREATGRPPDRARELQLELSSFEPGCVRMQVTPRDLALERSMMMIDGPLEEAVLRNLALGIEAARDGRDHVNPSVRKLVRFFGAGIRQRYTLRSDDAVERTVEFSSDEIAPAKVEHARTRAEHHIGRVRGIMVKPAEIVFEDENGPTRRFVASPELVEVAWTMRERVGLVASVVIGRREDRILALRERAAFDGWRAADHDVPVADIATRWAAHLELLAEYDRN